MWLKLSEDAKDLRFWKEILPVGKFTKGKEYEFEITEDFLGHLDQTFDTYTSGGTKVPIYSTHKESPETRMGSIVDVEIRDNDKGGKSLYGLHEFATQKDADVAIKNDVSVYIPDEGMVNGQEFRRYLKHVAVTSVPVIPGLGEFSAIAASFSEGPTSPRGNEMKSIAKLLGVEIKEDAKPEDVEKSIAKAISELKATADKFTASQKKTDAEKEKEKEKPKAIAASLDSIPPVQIRMLANSQKSMLESMVADEVITPAHRDDLIKEFCSDDAICLSLSEDSEETAFERMVRNLKTARPPKRTPDTLALSHDGDGVSVLVKNAEKMAKAGA